MVSLNWIEDPDDDVWVKKLDAGQGRRSRQLRPVERNVSNVIRMFPANAGCAFLFCFSI